MQAATRPFALRMLLELNKYQIKYESEAINQTHQSHLHDQGASKHVENRSDKKENI